MWAPLLYRGAKSDLHLDARRQGAEDHHQHRNHGHHAHGSHNHSHHHSSHGQPNDAHSHASSSGKSSSPSSNSANHKKHHSHRSTSKEKEVPTSYHLAGHRRSNSEEPPSEPKSLPIRVSNQREGHLYTESAPQQQLKTVRFLQEYRHRSEEPGSAVASGGKAMSDIVDLEEIVQRWAWQGFEYTKTKEQAKIPKEFLAMKVDWKFVKFNYEVPNYDIAPVAHPGDHIGDVTPQCVFKTTFTNVTNQGQEYSFKTERRTSSSAMVAVEKGFTAGMEFGMKLQTPCEVLEASAGFKREMTVMNIEEDTVEEELTWGVDSVVRVPAGHEATAELVITEAQTKGSFKMRVSMRGRILVSLTNMRDNNCLVTVMEGDISEIILREIERGAKNFRVEKNRTVVTDVVGKVHFKFGIEQRVIITERQVTPDARKSPRLPSPHRTGGTQYLQS